MSIDDLYNNFKIVEQKIKKTVGTSSGIQNLAFMTASSFSSTNDANTASSQVSAASPSVNTASPQCRIQDLDSTKSIYAWRLHAMADSLGELRRINQKPLNAYDHSNFVMIIS
ncbi:hypothetical protein Tco_0449195 [Tanacetum coccineum]